MPLRVRILLLRRLTDAGWPLVAVTVTVLLVNAVIPAVTAVATAATIAALRPGDRGFDALDTTAVPLAALGLALLVGQAADALLRPLTFLARQRIDGAHRERLAALAVSATTITDLERPAVQDLIKATSAVPATWVEKTPSDGALGQVVTMTRYVGLAATAAVVAQYSWWLIILLAGPALIVRMMHIRQWLNHFRIWAAGLSHHRYTKYWGEVATSPTEGKELRIFGSGEWLIARHQSHVHAHMGPVWADDRRAARSKWLFALLTFVPLAAAFYLVATGTAAGHSTIAVETAVLTASWSVYVTIGSTFDTVAAIGAVPVIEAFEELRGILGAGTVAEATSGTVAEATSGTVAEATSGTVAEATSGTVAEATSGTVAEAASGTVAEATPAAPPPLVRFEGVGFHYPDSTRAVLDGVDLEIRPGEMLAVVGLNGAGKSTLTKLLAGLYEPTRGRITAAGGPISDPAHGGVVGWRRCLAVVFQDFIRYQLSAADNVALGRADPGGPAVGRADPGGPAVGRADPEGRLWAGPTPEGRLMIGRCWTRWPGTPG